MKVNVRTNIDQNLVAKILPEANEILAIQAQKDTEPFVPAFTKSLSNRTQVKDGEIIYPGPYARYLYYGKLMVDQETWSAWASKGAVKRLTDKNLVFTKAVHGNAQSHWFEASKSLNLNKWLRVYGRALKRELKKQAT